MDKKLINEDIRNMKYLFGYKPGRVISEQDEPMDEPMDEEGSIESILEKHNLLDDVHFAKDNLIMFINKGSDVVQRFLNILPLLTKLQFISIIDCEFADFSDVDVCSLPKLDFINLQGTETNLDEQGYDCVANEGGGFFYID